MRRALLMAILSGGLVATAAVSPADEPSGPQSERFVVSTLDDELVGESLGISGLSVGVEVDHYSVEFMIEDGLVVDRVISLERPSVDRQGRERGFGSFTVSALSGVEIQWWDPSGGEVLWSIDRDGELIAQLRGASYVDHANNSDDPAVYTVTGEFMVEVEGELLPEPHTTIVAVPGYDDRAVGEFFSRSDMVGYEYNSDLLFLSSATQSHILLQYNTFIAEAVAAYPAGINFCSEAWGGGYYGGDGRSWAHPSDRYPSSRTSLELTRSWNRLPIPMLTSIGSDKWTSGTTLYNSDGSIREQANADVTNGIWFDWGIDDPYAIQETWKHAVSDPLCSVAPNIDYEHTFYTNGYGLVTLVGEHDQAPAHEFRVRAGDSMVNAFVSVYRFSNRGLEYLLPPFPNAHVDVSWNVNF